MNITLLIVTKENEYRVLNVGLSPSKKKIVLKMMKIAFSFLLKALFVFKIFKFLLWLFGYVGKTA